MKLVLSHLEPLYVVSQRFSIHFEAHIPSGRKNHFCTIWCLVFCITGEARTPWRCEHAIWEPLW